jgi:cell division protease FtsH
MVFLGEDLMHTRDYSDETSRVIDEEVERILREQEARAMEVLKQHRGGLEAVAAALLEKETIDGAEVTRLVDGAFGRPVHAPGVKDIPRFGTTEPTDAGPLDNGRRSASGRRSGRVAGRSDPDPTEIIDR